MKFVKGSIKRSLYYSIIDGLFNAMMMGVSEMYLIPYGIALGAKAWQIAYLAAIPMLVATILQTGSARLTQFIGSRLKLIKVVVFFHALSWVPIIGVPYFFRDQPQMMPYALLAAATVFASFGAFTLPAWQSLMSDYIPVKKRGKYFGWRNRLQGILMVGTSIAAGLTLNYFGKENVSGFTLIFVFAMSCRFYSWICLTKMKEPFRRTSHDVYFSFLDFLRDFLKTNFGRFVLWISAMSFCVNLSASLFAFFLLKDLGFSYASYMIVVTTASISGFLFQGLWGKFADLDGNIKILRIAGWGIAAAPLLWLVSQNLAFAIMIQVIAGASWGGFNLLITNFLQESITPERRIRSVSYFNAMNSTALLLGAAAGGFLFARLPSLFGYSYLTLFLISCLGRIFVMKWFSAKVKEVRGGEPVQKAIKSREILRRFH